MYIRSNRGGEKFVADGYMYIYDKTSSDGKMKFWRCEFKSDKCRARIHTSVETNEILRKLNEHIHKPDHQRIVATQMRNLLKRKVEVMSTVSAIKTEINEMPKDEQSSINESVLYIKEEPMFKASQEDEESNQQISPLMINTSDVPKSLTTYDLGRGRKVKFFLDDYNGTNEILIFAREDYKEWAKFMKIIHIDSTIKSVPYFYSQICLIMAERNTFVFTIMYVFLQDTTTESFQKLFQQIKKLWPEFDPSVIYTDYVSASHLAIKREFPSANIYGNYYFLQQMFKDKLNEYDVLNKYYNNGEFAVQTRMILGIAFVHKDDVKNAVNILEERLPNDLLKILKWFEETFIRNSTKEDSSNTFRYPFEMWSVYNKLANGQCYTNERFEFVDREAHVELRTENNLMSQFIIGFQVIQRKTDAMYEAFIKGETAPIDNVHERLMYLVTTYKERTLYEYLRGVAINIFW